MKTSVARPPPQRRLKIAGVVLLALGLLMVAGIAAGEWLGWPFLATPLQSMLSDKLNRRVTFSVDADAKAIPANNAAMPSFGIRFIGGLHVDVAALQIAAPAWTTAPYLLVAREVSLDLRYLDLWRAYRGQPVRIDRLQAAMLDANLERRADGQASWQFSPTPKPIPSFGYLQVANGTLRYQDVPLAIDVEANLSLSNGVSLHGARPIRVGNITSPQDGARNVPTSVHENVLTNVLKATAAGHYGDKPVKIDLVSSGVLPWAADETQAVAVPLTLDATVGRANLRFNGSAMDALHLSGFSGHFSLSGPSLAAVGDSVGVTLPTTGAFHTVGVVVKKGETWRVLIEDATVGASRLNGAFTYEKSGGVPLLSGRLGGSRLLMVDLGPVVGTTAATTAATEDAASKPLPAAKRHAGMTLPDRPFDLPAMRAMDANILIDIREVDLNSRLLEPLRPLHVHLQLNGGLLTLSDLDARTGQGKLTGKLSLDGRAAKALWNADLRWRDVQLEKFIHQDRANAAPPYVSGRMSGSATLKGQGRSTAEILGSLKGTTRTELREGKVSHLAIEVAGLDVAQALGVLFKGDDALSVQCAVADLGVDGGVFRPRVMVFDTSESAIWVEGSLSLATEAIDLRAVVTPKDFSPLTLRTPLLVRGTFAAPQISVEKAPLAKKLATAFLLSLANPLAALIPLVDPGDAEEAKRAAASCRGLFERSKARLGAVAPVR